MYKIKTSKTVAKRVRVRGKLRVDSELKFTKLKIGKIGTRHNAKATSSDKRRKSGIQLLHPTKYRSVRALLPYGGLNG